MFQIRPKIANLQKKSPAAPRRAVGILFSKLNGFDHFWKNAPNPTEDRKSSKNSPAAGSSVHLPQN
jgi:hypothetical protein